MTGLPASGTPSPRRASAGVPPRAVNRTAGRPDPIGDTPARQANVWNVANLLTMLRLVLVPGFVLLLVHDGGQDPAWRSFAWAAFSIAMITDLFDGELARRNNLVTDFGKIADPIADKAIMGSALVCLSALGDLPWWVTGVILVREIGITLMRFWVIRHGVIPASRGGKMKTLAQGVAVGMYVLALTGPLATLRAWAMAAAVVLTVATGLDYVRQAVVLRREGLRRQRREPAASAGEASGGAAVSAGPGVSGTGGIGGTSAAAGADGAAGAAGISEAREASGPSRSSGGGACGTSGSGAAPGAGGTSGGGRTPGSGGERVPGGSGEIGRAHV